MALRFVSGVALPDGTFSAPSLAFSSNPDVGFFYEVTAIGVGMDGVETAKFLPTGFETDIVACGDTTVLDELDFLGYTLDSKLKVDRTVYGDLNTTINIESASTSFLEVQNSGTVPKFGVGPWYGSAAYAVQASGGTGMTTLGGGFSAAYAYGEVGSVVYGMHATAGIGDTGDAVNAYGGQFSVLTDGSAEVDNAVSVYMSNSFSASGTYVNNIGLYATNTNDGVLFDASTASNIYSVGVASVNRFEGHVAVGNPLMTVAPDAQVDIRPGSNDVASLRVTGTTFPSSTENIQEWYTSSPSLALRIDSTGDLRFEDSVDIGFGAVTGSRIGDASTQKIGFWGATPVARDTGWSTANVTSSLSFDADTVSLAELADVVGTLVDRLLTVGLLGA